MSHLSEEELILHYYSEEGDGLATEQHLDSCDECRHQYGALQRVLNVVDTFPVPARSADYGARVWQRIEGGLPVRRGWWRFEWRMAAAAASVVALLALAFLAGRFYPAGRSQPPVVQTAADRQANQRVLLVAVGDFLERSQLVLVELTNAKPSGKLDISAEQERAADLVSEDRLYRQTALHTGDTTMAGALEELERILVDISHEPPQMPAGELESLQQRMEAAGILFKIRVLGTNVKNQQDPAKPIGRPAGGQKL